MKTYLRYPGYQSSKTEWIGDIPSHWSLDRIGNVFSERREKVSDSDFEPLSVTMNGIVPQLDSVAKTNAGDNRRRVCKGDFVINSRSDRRGSSGVSVFDGSVSLISTVIKPERIHPNYAHYLLKSLRFQEEYYRHGSGIVSDLWSTNFSSMKNIIIPYPPIDEQRSISDFLGHESNQLDELRNQHRFLIKAMKEKKKIAVSKGTTRGSKVKISKIAWLDKIPLHWKEIKAKFLFKEMNRNVRLEDDIVTVFRDGQVCLRKKRRVEGFTMAVLEHGYQGVREGDLVLHSMDAFAGAIGVSEDDGRATPEYVVMTPFDTRHNCHYFAEVLRIMAERNYIFVICPSVRERAPRFRFSKFSEVTLPVPPIEEQNAIAEYISNIQMLEKNSEWLLKLKDERFNILANDVVLGKIDVRNWQTPPQNQTSKGTK